MNADIDSYQSQFDRIYKMALNFFNGNSRATLDWLSMPQESFLGESAIEMILMGDGDQIEAYLIVKLGLGESDI